METRGAAAGSAPPKILQQRKKFTDLENKKTGQYHAQFLPVLGVNGEDVNFIQLKYPTAAVTHYIILIIVNRVEDFPIADSIFLVQKYTIHFFLLLENSPCRERACAPSHFLVMRLSSDEVALSLLNYLVENTRLNHLVKECGRLLIARTSEFGDS